MGGGEIRRHADVHGLGRGAPLLLGLVLVVGLVLTACGSARETPPTPPSVTTPSPATDAAPTPGATATSAPAASTLPDLRTIDWREHLLQDPDLQQEPAPAGFPAELGDLYLVYTPAEIAGFPALDGILFGDLDDDGHDEAIIPITSGGTAGLVGLLIYQATPDGPRLVTAKAGFDLSPRMTENGLAVHEPVRADWQPRCCPSAWSETLYRLAGDRLEAMSEQIEPAQGTEQLTVERFYMLLGERRYEEAYALLSPAFQAAHPYDTWVSGFAETEEITAYVAQSEPGTVTVNLATTERDGDGGTRERFFSGTWSVIFSSEQRTWLLDEAAIREVS